MAKKTNQIPFKSKVNKESKEQKQLIDLFVNKKKANPNYIATRDEFCANEKGIRQKINKHFGSFKNFLSTAHAEYINKLPTSHRALLSEQSKKFNDTATVEDCILDLRSVQENNPLIHVTRNYYRENGSYSDSTWNSHFGTFQEFRRQAGLELTRNQHQLERDIAKHAAADLYKEFFIKEVQPFYRKYEKEDSPEKIKRIMVASDVHDEECDEFSLSVFIDTCAIKQPDVIVLNGDIFDCYEFSKFSIDPRQIRIKERFDFVKERIFRPLRTLCPNAQIDFVMGNHEFRILRLLADATPNVRVLLSEVMDVSFASIFGVDEFQINWVSKVDFKAFTKQDIGNELRQNYQVYYGCYVVCHEPDDKLLRSMSGTNGHHHKAHLSSHVNLTYGSITWAQTPALHAKDAEYLKNLSDWNTGFLEVIINTEKKEVIQKIHSTFDWCEIDGVYYERKKDI